MRIPTAASSIFALLFPLSTIGQSEPPNRVSLSFRSTFNIGARFSGPESRPSGADPGPFLASGINRNYEDGYVRVDSEGNAQGLTWNWGYRDASQVQADALHFHSASVSGSGNLPKMTDDPNLGFEFAWERRLFQFKNGRAGIKGAFNFTDVEIRDRRKISRDLILLTDVYPLNGIIPPGSGMAGEFQYAGTFDGPGPVIDDHPESRNVTTIPGGGAYGRNASDGYRALRLEARSVGGNNHYRQLDCLPGWRSYGCIRGY